MSLRDAILQAQDLPREAVDVQEWGVTVYVQTMTAGARDSWEAAAFDFSGPDGKATPVKKDFRAILVVRCLVDEAGGRLFGDDEAALLSAKSADVLSRLYKVAARVNGIGGEAEEGLKKD